MLWREFVAPLIVIEFGSGDGSEERDKTPLNRNQPGNQKPGKFWVYERIIRPAFYGIYEVEKASVEVYHFVENNYELVVANERGHYSIPQMGVELGIWQGRYGNMELPWLRWWDSQGNLLLTGEERAEVERQRAELAESELEQQRQQAETERQRAERLAERLRELGVNPDEI